MTSERYFSELAALFSLPVTFPLVLDPFSNVALSVMAADVRFEEGEAYGLRYRLHPDELVVRAEAEGETLYFSTEAKEGASLRLVPARQPRRNGCFTASGSPFS